MTMIRDHKMFELLIRKDTRTAIRDNVGDLKGYSDPFPTEGVIKVVAPSEAVAIAWVIDQATPGSNCGVIRCTAHDLDGCILHFAY